MSTTSLNSQPGISCQTDNPEPDLELRGYAYAFREWLESAGDFSTLKQQVTKELQRLGFTDWSYLRLDVPFSFSKPIGTFQKEHYEYDLMYQHLATSKSPVFRSLIKEFIEQSPIETEVMRKNRELLSGYEKLGYHDCIGIPLYFYGKENHAAFSLAAKGDDSKTFKDKVSACKEKLNILIEIFDKVGNDIYPEFFIGIKKNFDHIKYSKRIRLLEIMVKRDCGIEQAAHALHISRAAADKQLAKLRELLNVSTTHTAVFKALELRLIHCDDIFN